MKRDLKVINNVTHFKTKYLTTKEELDTFQNQLLSDWELQQKAKGYTKESIALNIRNVDEFLYLIDKYIWEINPNDVDLFYSYLVGRNLSHSTRRKYQSNINTFTNYLKQRKSIEIYEKVGITLIDVFDSFNKYFHRIDDNDMRVVPPKPEIINVLFKHMKLEMSDGRKYYSLARDYVFFKLLNLLGIRINELVMVNKQDIRFDLGSSGIGKIHIRYGKGSRGYGPKPRWVPLINETDVLLEWYLKEIYPFYVDRANGTTALFISERGDRIKRDTMRGSLTRRQLNAGIPKEETFSAHQLRHSFATNMTKDGVDILTLSKLLGHSNIATTSGYIDPESEYIEKRLRLSKKKWKNDLMNGGELNERKMETEKYDGKK
ncbi:tyrosine-type recombinase/integrase [Staphylococcus arlettae]|uniref:tyrosine-type recombinase/integrase n=1 Tax=Staphylococcus TaxID=1279 RepID=UPI001E35D954|nr:site-specific integrase [Staphylococcus arlettae]MCD8838317.1 site-specific integrase [Staphylococcus arlettae]MCD8865510.1 site-specific integrase [Staphylococcus arlettae]